MRFDLAAQFRWNNIAAYNYKAAGGKAWLSADFAVSSSPRDMRRRAKMVFETVHRCTATFSFGEPRIQKSAGTPRSTYFYPMPRLPQPDGPGDIRPGTAHTNGSRSNPPPLL